MPAQCPCCKGEMKDESMGSCLNCYRKLNSYRLTKEKRCQICFSLKEERAKRKQNCQRDDVLCNGRQLFFDEHISLYQMSKEWGSVLKSWKYEGNRYLYKSFLPFLLERTIDLFNWNIHRIGYIDSGAGNLDLRPYQPCHDLAIFLSHFLKIPWGKDIYKKKKQQQSQNKYSERFFSIHNSLGVVDNFPHPAPENYLLLEDVYTSGATANEAARMLKKYNVARVYIISMIKAREN